MLALLARIELSFTADYEAISLITIGVDFGITQVVDGNWGVHAVIKKDIFAGGET